MASGSPRAEFFTDEDRRAMRIRIPIHPAFLEVDDEVLLPDSYEKATKKASESEITEWHQLFFRKGQSTRFSLNSFFST